MSGLPRLSVVNSADAQRKTANTVNALAKQVQQTSVFVSVTSFGAKADSDSSGSTGTDNTAAIQKAIDSINAKGGGTLYFPAGYYKVTSYVTLCKNLRLVGDGKNSTFIIGTHAGGGGANAAENLRNGSILYSQWTINGSTPTCISVEHIGISLVNGSNVGACFYDSAGSEWSISNCVLGGGKYGVVLEQSEVAHIDLCDIGSHTTASIYIPNGSLTPGALTGFNNVISVRRCNIDGSTHGSIGILHEGGLNFVAEDNNYNGGSNHLQLIGVTGEIRGGEYEGATGDCISLTSNCIIAVRGGSFSVAVGQSAINGSGAAGVLEVSGTPLFVGGGGTAPITGGSNFVAMYRLSYNNQSGHTSSPVDSTASFFDVDMVDDGHVARATSFLINGVTFSATGGVSGITGGLTLGNHTQVASTTPLTLDLGATYSSVAGANAKARLFYDGTDTFGFGVSLNSLDYIITLPGTSHNFYANAVKVATIDGGGINLPSGEAYKVNGTQVVAARQTGTAADATDLATAITLVNDLKAKLVAHGLIS